jgi:uncharacterized protein
VGHKAFSEFCRKQTAVLQHLFGLLEAGGPNRQTLMSWL